MQLSGFFCFPMQGKAFYVPPMKRLLYPAAFVFCLVLAVAPARASGSAPASTAPANPGLELATMLTQITGVAISPMLGTSAIGAYQYFEAKTPEQKAKLAWFAQPAVWVTGLLLVGACAFKDSCGAFIPPGLKKPFDMLELAENKVNGLVATGAVVPVLVNIASKFVVHPGTSTAHFSTGSVGGLAMLHLGMVDWSWALDILMVPLAVVVFAIVWVVSHAINVLILISPWGALDAALKSGRTALLGLVTATAYVNPYLGAALSVAIIIVAYFLSGWAFRLMIFGSVFSWDFLSLRRHRFTPDQNGNWVFMGREFNGVPIRTYGKLMRADDGSLQLAYRPWLFLPQKTAAMPKDGLAVGRGLFWPTLEFRDGSGKDRTLLTLPPRYKGHEAEFGASCGVREIRDVGLRRGWALLKELFGGKPAAQPAAA